MHKEQGLTVDHVIVRYGEIGIKGNNRVEFEKVLVKNIQLALSAWPQTRVSRTSGRVIVALCGAPQDEVSERICRVFGVTSISAVYSSSLEFERILEVVSVFIRNFKLRCPAATSFKIEVKRANKQFFMTTPQIAQAVGSAVLQQHPGYVVNVHRPDVVVWIEIREQAAYIYGDRTEAVGGMPTGTSGKVGLLLSGGIDSPVAGWLSLKRGVTLEAIHFQSFPFTSERALEKVHALTQKLANWGHQVRLHAVHFTDIQVTIRKQCPPHMQTILGRRMMMRVADRIARDNGLLALVTGDSLGQVASQTLESLHVVNAVTTLPVLRPLISEDKVDIIHRARAIGTYETSILPYEDCCTVFAPKRPRTRPALADTLQAEQGLPIEGLIASAMNQTVLTTFFAQDESVTNNTSYNS